MQSTSPISRLLKSPFRIPAFLLLLLLPLNLSSHPVVYLFSIDISRDVIASLRAGDAQGLSQYLNPMVDLTIPGYSNTCSKQQTTRLLKEFFSKSKIKDFKLIRKGVETQDSYYIFGDLETASLTFRSYLLIKKSGSEEFIQQIKIEEN